MFLKQIIYGVQSYNVIIDGCLGLAFDWTDIHKYYYFQWNGNEKKNQLLSLIQLIVINEIIFPSISTYLIQFCLNEKMQGNQ